MRVLAQTKYGQMLVNELDQYVGKSLLLYGEFSAGEQALFAHLIQPGWVVIDIGANIGAHTLWFSKIVGPDGMVIAYEPQRLVFQMLCANMALNQVNNVFCRQAAIGAVDNVIQIGSLDPDQNNNFGGIPLEAMPGGETVPVERLNTPCHFIKIDVEGMEQEVLLGAARMIEQWRPWLYVENDRIERSDDLIKQIRDMGYTPYWHITSMYNVENFRHIPENIFGDIASINMLCAPPGSEVSGMDEAFGGTYQDYLKEKHHAGTQQAE
jgi:FkbM family methyltransferase